MAQLAHRAVDGQGVAGLFDRGQPRTVESGLVRIIAETRADELILTAQIYDHKARLRSFEIAAELRPKAAALAASVT
ncbi:hypothetical protein [Bradyrhizobium sp. CCBAU 51765]|uniref:hypothetical protein n=1 Tax=Bradyrhizobium sp. CCBAU 51765 TaxID=1325102 RepID=UPI001886E5EF|nr:hypothetical protein XH96_11310 [Bradyrhizobium sp. CCBAU 51765]